MVNWESNVDDKPRTVLGSGVARDLKRKARTSEIVAVVLAVAFVLLVFVLTMQ